MLKIERDFDVDALRAGYIYMFCKNAAMRKTNALTYLLCAVVFLTMFIYLWNENPANLMANLPWIVLAIGVWFLLTKGFSIIFSKLWVRFWLAQRSVQSTLGKAMYEFDTDGATVHSHMGTSTLNWSAFTKAEFTDDYLMITIANGSVIPIRRLSDGDDTLMEVCRLIESNAGAKN